jgi:cytochrome c6
MNKRFKTLSGCFIATVLLSIATAAAADGKDTYEHNCAKCHGADAKGQTNIGKKLEIKDFSDAKAWPAIKPGADVQAVKQGVKDGDKTKMKAFTDLTDGDIQAVLGYMKGLSK